jgi:V-type H+-transporting ATPase subunit a
MFGDILHGAMIFAVGVYAIFNEEKLATGMFKILGKMRYMVTLMGFFAIYCGFVYNDFAGFNMNFFGSCYNPPPHPHTGP